MWGGRGANARPREAEWNSGLAAVFGYVTYNKNLFKDPHDYSYDGRDKRNYSLLIRVRAVAYDPVVTC